ncbi:MAG: TerC family protein [Acidobacteria bacterium]|nr:TerC family protein [Acidobacteriota bacterium]
MHFLLSAFSIVLIDLLLAGDNALVIALAVRSLEPRERRIGMAGGALVAVALRVALTFVAAEALTIRYLQVAGGLFVLWIAVKVLIDASEPAESSPAPKRFWQAIWYIVVADITMSTDNILAIAGASHGHFLLILFGLGLSIPFIVASSNLLCRLMERWPGLVLVGSAILGKVGGEMVLTDPVVEHAWSPGEPLRWTVEAVLALALMAYGFWRTRRVRAAA